MTVNDAAATSVADAIAALSVAENHFQWAEPEYVDAAIYELLAARARLDGMVREAKEARYDLPTAELRY